VAVLQRTQHDRSGDRRHPSIDGNVLTWAGFVLRNLLPVTIGNLLGGAGLVGGVYWFIYLRTRRGA
jgi:formate/nitrite transporter FocA (FNT family)